MADNRVHDHSDIDILVMPLDNSLFWQMRAELEEVVNAPVDLYTDRDDPQFTQKIVERGVKIYEIQP